MEAIGSVDELNSAIGLLVAFLKQDPGSGNGEASNGMPFESLSADLEDIQSRLFDAGALLASVFDREQFQQLSGNLDPAPLESMMDSMDSNLPPLRQFILPGGSLTAAQAHVCRSVCRRAERTVVSVQPGEFSDGTVDSPGWIQLLQYVNRLGDFFFVLGRSLNHAAGGTETAWSATRK